MLPCLTRDWDGETVFVVCGGPSVLKVDLNRLRGQRVVAINSSYRAVPWADALVFTDLRWWRMHHNLVRQTFVGQIVTITPHNPLHDGLLVLERQRSSGLSTDPTRLVCWHTSLTTTINMIVLRGARRICLLGLDGEGGWHHEPHPVKWGVNVKKFSYHREALEALVEPLSAAGVQVLNLNHESKHTMFPFGTLDDALAERIAA